jgi:uncharacterized membrane protein
LPTSGQQGEEEAVVEERRLDVVEGQIKALSARLQRLECELTRRQAPKPERVVAEPLGAAPAPRRPALAATSPRRSEASATPSRPVAAPRGTAPPERRPPAGTSLEDLLGGRVLAWVGGLAVLLGVAFLFAVAISHGWIGEGARTLIAASGSSALLVLGVWLHERKGRTDAALAAVASGIAALFVTVTVAAQVYELVPVSVALALALLVGAIAMVLAVRWAARGIGALGIVGALLAPVLAGAPSSGGTLALLFVAGASAAGVLLWQRWDWLAFAAFVVTTPQWLAWLFDAPSVGGALTVLALFGALNVAVAIGFELRVPASRLRSSSTFLLALNALVLALAGWLALVDLEQRPLAELWLVGLAGIHLTVGLCASRIERVSHEIGLVALVLGVVAADVALAVIASGPVLVASWAGGAALFAWLAGRVRRRPVDETLAGLGLGTHVTLSLLHALMVDAEPSMLVHGGELSGAAVALVALAAGCFVSARLAAEGHSDWRVLLDALGLAAVAYLAALALDGPQLAVAWALEAAVLAQVARQTGDKVAGWAAAAHLGGALAHGVVFEAPPEALIYGLRDVPAAAGALGAGALAALRCAQLVIVTPRWRPAFVAVAAVALLYLASAALVTPLQPGTERVETLLELGVRQQGQVLMSALWSVVGVVALVVGLSRDLRLLRAGALALLLTTVGKVFLFDLAVLTSVYRVVSFIALGLLLLAAAFLWQRMRPQPLEDLRVVPDGVRR